MSTGLLDCSLLPAEYLLVTHIYTHTEREGMRTAKEILLVTFRRLSRQNNASEITSEPTLDMENTDEYHVAAAI